MANPKKQTAAAIALVPATPAVVPPAPATETAPPLGSHANPLPDQTAINPLTDPNRVINGPADTIGEYQLGSDGRRYKRWHLLPKMPAEQTALWAEVDDLERRLIAKRAEAKASTIGLFSKTEAAGWHLPAGIVCLFGQSKKEKLNQVWFASPADAAIAQKADRVADDNKAIAW